MPDPAPQGNPSPRRPLRIPPSARLVLVSLFASLLLVGCGAVGSGATIPTALLLLWFAALTISGFLVGCMGGSAGNQTVPRSSSSSSTIGVASGLQFLTSPSKMTVGKVEALVPITPAPRVAIVDDNGNTVTTATNAVTLSLAPGSPGVLQGTLTVNAVAGIATFNDVRVSLAGNDYVLVASAANLTSAESAAFVVNPLPPVFRAGQSRVDSPGGVTYGAGRDANVSGDFNNDGKLDVATAGSWGGGGSAINVLLGDGQGNLDAGQGIPAALVAGAAAMATGDFNNDGNLDLVVSDPVHYTAHVLLGTGNGHFQASVNYPVNGGVNAVAVGDFNNDGRRDVAFSLIGTGGFPAPGAASVMMGNGDGTFQAAANYGPFGVGNGIAVGRFNSDGNDDLAVTQTNGHIQLLLGNGDGQFSAGSNLAVTTGPVTSPLAVHLTSGGATDLVVSEPGAGQVWQLLGNGTGTFSAPTSTPVASVTTIAPADLNTDGQTDVVATLSNARAAVLLNNGGTLTPQATTYPVSRSNGAEITPLPGDFNNDGKTDVVVSCANVESLLVGKGDGTFIEPPTQNAVGSMTWTELKDVDGDGKLDLLSVGNVNVFGFSKGNGDGTFQTPPVPATVGSAATQFTTGDINNDGKVDAAVATGKGTQIGVNILLGNGSGGFTPVPGSFTAASSGVALSDFNKDGKLDVVTSVQFGTAVEVLLGNGDGSFRSPNTIPAGQNPEVPTVGDFNSDGNPDLVVPSSANGDVSVFLGNGDGTFRAPQNFTVFNTQAATAGDFNRDGKLDLAISAGYDGVTVMLGNGDGTFSRLGPYRGAIDAGNGQAVDFNADGKTDLVLGSATYQDVGVMIGNGDGTFQAPILIGTNATNNQAAVGDLQGDGKPDIVSPDNAYPTATVNMHQ